MRAELRDSLEFLDPDSQVGERPCQAVSLDVARGGIASVHILLNDLPDGESIHLQLRERNQAAEDHAQWFRLVDVPVEANTGPVCFIEKEGEHNPFVIRRAPFRVYDAGFTLTRVPLKDGMKRRDVLVPFDRLRRVEVVDNSMGGFVYHTLELSYKGSEGEGKLVLGHSEVEDPLAAMLALAEAARDKLTDKATRYVDDGAFERLSAMKPAEVRGGPAGAAILLLLGIMVFFSLQMGFLTGTNMSMFGVGIMLVPLLFIIVTSVPTAMMLARKGFVRTLTPKADLEGDCIVIPVPFMYRMVANIRHTIPVAEIAEVRLALDPHRYRPMTKWITVRGERFSGVLGLFGRFEVVSGFEREGFALRNRGASTEPGPPVFEKSPAKGLTLAFGILALALLAAIISSPFDFQVEASDNSWYPLVALVFVSIALPILLIYSALTSRRTALAEGFLASDRGITVPNAREPFRWISDSAVESCRVGKDGLGYHIVLRTPEGSLKLPLSLADKLRGAGHEVVDAHDVLDDMEDRG